MGMVMRQRSTVCYEGLLMGEGNINAAPNLGWGWRKGGRATTWARLDSRGASCWRPDCGVEARLAPPFEITLPTRICVVCLTGPVRRVVTCCLLNVYSANPKVSEGRERVLEVWGQSRMSADWALLRAPRHLILSTSRVIYGAPKLRWPRQKNVVLAFF